MKEKSESKLLTIKIHPDLLVEYADFAKSINLKRGTMVKKAVADFMSKQKQQAA